MFFENDRTITIMAKNSTNSNSADMTNKGDPLNTPVMRQYLDLKKGYPDAILFFRMGDFYEMFMEDAEKAAPIMDIAITHRQNSIPMAGVPYHSVDTYISRLIGAGEKVAIAEQESDPGNPKLMRRAVKRIITPGTLLEDSLLQGSFHNYILSISELHHSCGFAIADISTGSFFTMEIELPEENKDLLQQELRYLFAKYSPREILLSSDLQKKYKELLPEAEKILTPCEPWKASPIEGKRQIQRYFSADLRGLGYENDQAASIGAASLILHYLDVTLPEGKNILGPPVFQQEEKIGMRLDEQTIRNLDLIFNYQEGTHNRTIFGVTNFCRTAPGRRRLKEAILAPLLKKDDITLRHEMLDYLVSNQSASEKISLLLDQTSDLERILSRQIAGKGAPRDFIALRKSYKAAVELLNLFKSFPESVKYFQNLITLNGDLENFADEIENKIVSEPAAIAGKSPFLNRGINPELDNARDALEKGSQWILNFETKERERTSISTLRVRYNKVVGYFIEISKGQADKAPENYERRQTLVGNERFTCHELKELETTILQADEIIERIEHEAFRHFAKRLLELQNPIKILAKELAEIDFLFSLARAALLHNWSKPIITEDGQLLIEDGRHPVVEAFLPPGESFVPNSTNIDNSNRSFAILTGPNMAGKSTFIRQIALIQLMAQIGSFVPARHAVISIADRIFTRIGASDNLTRGESTFYVEMVETARILNQATERSLVIMDEVGRGTSTYDGLSIAWAVAEYFSGEDEKKPRVLFATHYHELTVLESRNGIFNLTMDVREEKGKVVFLHRVMDGKADQSYGIHVAVIAGLPPEVTQRASEKLKELESEYQQKKEMPVHTYSKSPGFSASHKKKPDVRQESLF